MRAADGAVVVDDAHESGGLNVPGNGGLGAFGWHDARKVGRSFDYDAAWAIDGRTCAYDGFARRPDGTWGSTATGVGVTRTWIFQKPRIVVAPDGSREGLFGMDVWLNDNHVSARTPMLRVRYRYVFHPAEVDVWMTVSEFCPDGRCGWGPRPVFVKEPKFVAAVTGGGYTRMVVTDPDGEVAQNRLEQNTDGEWRSPACEWMGVNAREHTGQCDDPQRSGVRFDYGGYGSTADGCTPARPCLDVTMQAASGQLPGSLDAPWQGSGLGLDGWAVASGARRAYAPTDSRLDGVRWDCKSPTHSITNPASPADPILRRWELAGATKDAHGGYTAASVLFNGWEGGRGFGDCEPDSRLFGPAGESWSVHATYAFDAG